MNYLAAVLLLFYPDESQAFHMLVYILENRLPADYYNDKMIGTVVDTRVLVELLRQQNFPVYQHIVTHVGIDLTSICVPWFTCLYLTTLPIETCLRVLDAFMLEGYKVLFRVGLALFDMHQKEILAIDDFGELHQYLCKMAKTDFDADALLQKCFKVHLRRNMIVQLRNQHRKLAEEDFRAVNCHLEDDSFVYV